MNILRVSILLLILISISSLAQESHDPSSQPAHRPLSPVYALELPFGSSLAQVVDACRRHQMTTTDSATRDGRHIVRGASYELMGRSASLELIVSDSVGLYWIGATVTTDAGTEAAAFLRECVEDLASVFGQPKESFGSRSWWVGSSNMLLWQYDWDVDPARGRQSVVVYAPVRSDRDGRSRTGFVWCDLDRATAVAK